MKNKKFIDLNLNDLNLYDISLGYILKKSKNSYLIDFNNEYSIFLDFEIFYINNLNIGDKVLIFKDQSNEKNFVILEYNLFSLFILLLKLRKFNNEFRYINIYRLIYIGFILLEKNLISLKKFKNLTLDYNTIDNILEITNSLNKLDNSLIYLKLNLIGFNKLNLNLLVNTLKIYKFNEQNSFKNNSLNRYFDINEINKWKN